LKANNGKSKGSAQRKVFGWYMSLDKLLDDYRIHLDAGNLLLRSKVSFGYRKQQYLKLAEASARMHPRAQGEWLGIILEYSNSQKRK